MKTVSSCSIPVILLCLALLIGLSGCMDETTSVEGYWRFSPPMQARVLNNAILSVKGEDVLVLSYFGGPMLSPGVNTETTPKRLMGNVRCGRIAETENGITIVLYKRFELGGDGIGEVVNESFLVDPLNSDSLIIDRLMNYPEVPYVRTDKLLNEETLVFQEFENSCKNQ